MQTEVSIAYYNKEQYEQLLKVADDRPNLHDRWEDWLAEYAKARMNLERQGLKVNQFNVDVAQMAKYFKEKREKNTSANRAEYVSRMASLTNR